MTAPPSSAAAPAVAPGHAGAAGDVRPDGAWTSAGLPSLPPGPLTEDLLATHIRPLFARSLAPGRLYLAEHVLGLPPDRVQEHLDEALRAWAEEPARFAQEDERWRALLARLLELDRADTIVATASVAQAFRRTLEWMRKSPLTILTTACEPPGVESALAAVQTSGRARVHRVRRDEHGMPHTDPIIDRLDERVDLVVISTVYPDAGVALEGVDRIVEAAHDVGALVLVNVEFSVGLIPWPFMERDADVIIGTCARFLRGGPGTAFAVVHPRHRDGQGPLRLPRNVQTPEPAEASPGAFLASPGLELTLAIGVGRLHEHAVSQLAWLRARLAERGLVAGQRAEPPSPGPPLLLLPCPNASEAVASLRAAGVVVDAVRMPDGRAGLCLSPSMLLSANDLDRAVEAIAQAIGAQASATTQET